MDLVATYDELTKMDDETFVKAVKAQQITEAKSVADNEAKSVIYAARDKELKAFDEDAQTQMGALQMSLSMQRTVIEQKYAAQLSGANIITPEHI